jgi:hypothetical protein
MIMRQVNLSKFAWSIPIALFMAPLVSAGEAAPRVRHLGPTNRDATMACIQTLYGKPALWDRVGVNVLIQPCPATREELTEALTKVGMRLFDAHDFIFVTPEKLFHPSGAPAELYPGGALQAWQALGWTTIRLHLQVQKLRDDQDLPAHANELARQILEQARMIPLAVSQGPADGFPDKGAVDADLNIALWQGTLGPREEQTVIACINARGRTVFATARLVYGVLLDGQYVMLWDSPLFNVLHGAISFQDVDADGNQEIVIESTNYGNKEYPMLVIFNGNGREITRQKKCDTNIAADANFSEEDGTCAIFGEDIAFSENAEGPKEIYVRNWYDGKNHVFKLNKDGSYVPGAPVLGQFPPEPPLPPSPDPAQLNQQGIRFMRLKDYASAIIAFERADLLVAHKNPEYANNVGFAMYKAGRYEASVDWLNTTISLDPKRDVAYLNLGDALVKLNRNAEAREAYRKYLELAPDSKSAPEVKKKLEALPQQ